MWKTTIKGILAHKVRLMLTALAVVLGVGFVAGTYILTDTMGSAFDGLFSEVNSGVAVEVSGVPQFEANRPGGENAGPAERIPESLLQPISQVPGVRSAVGGVAGYAQLVDKQGEAITTGGAPTLGVTWVDDPELSPLSLRDGRAPQAQGEIGIDAATAEEHGFRVGDRTTVLLQGPPMDAEVVGIFGFGTSNNLLGATLVAFETQTAQIAFDAEGKFDTILVAAEERVSPTELRDRIQRILPEGAQAETGEEAAANDAADIKEALSFLNIALLVFAGVAVFVGAFIIFNTFSILVAQRTRELALLRALGASPGQVRRSVIAEAFVVGIFASLVGLGAGVLIALGLQGLLTAFGIDLPSTDTQILPRTVVISLLVGILTTVVASVAPAWRASRIAPIAAMRETEPGEYRTPRARIIVGAVVTLAGAAMLFVGLLADGGVSAVGLGAALVFFGVAVLSPVIVRPVARALGAPLPRLRGVSGKLGRENALRNPKRTAATSAALMIGLGLVAFVSIFAASIKASATKVLDDTLRADYLVSTEQFMGFSRDVAAQLREEDAFGTVSAFRSGVFGYKGRAVEVSAIDPATIEEVAQVEMVSGRVGDLGVGDVLVYRVVAQSEGWRVGETFEVEFARTGEQTLRVAGIHDNNFIIGNYAISLETFEHNFTEQLDTLVLAKAAPGVPQEEARAAVERVAETFPNVKIEDQAEFRDRQAGQIDQLLGLITALLGLAILIALFGIVNTLALSIFERTREIGLLRAVGMGRGQIRSMIRWEAIIIAVFGALLGTAVGIFFGWAMVQALKSEGITELAIPGSQLAIYVVLAGVAGVLAAIGPARRAAKMDILRAVTTE